MGCKAALAVVVGILAVGAQAIIAPYDFTGHWTGMAQTPGKPVAMLSADLTTMTPPEFTGTLTAVTTEETFNCTVNGRQGRRVVMAAPCNNTGRFHFRGKVDPASGTLSGKMIWKPPPAMHKRPKHGVFTLTKQS